MNRGRALLLAVSATVATLAFRQSPPKIGARAVSSENSAASHSLSTPRPASGADSSLGLAVSPTVSPTVSLAGDLPLSPITNGPRDRPRIALTFDADMTRSMLQRLSAGEVQSWYDNSIVDQLTSTATPATIFLTGLWAKTYPDAVRSLAANPLFELENHSMDHRAFQGPCNGLDTVESTSAKAAEIADAASIISDLTGRRPIYFRFPGGCFSREDLRLVSQAREQTASWDVVSGDPFQPNPAVVAHSVLSSVQPGSIVVMHLMGAPNAPATSRALRQIIPAVKARGYEFVKLADLLAR